jgi:hypothetical protein
MNLMYYIARLKPGEKQFPNDFLHRRFSPVMLGNYEIPALAINSFFDKL